jgi:hypothetical protein
MDHAKKKWCTGCEKEKDFEQDFHKNKSQKDGHAPWCKQCVNASTKRWASSKHGIAKKRAVTREKIQRNKEFVFSYLSTHPCIDCPESDPVVLEFDHVRGEKKDIISKLIFKTVSIARIVAEIEKCVVRCANCHRRKTAKDRTYFRQAQSVG